MWSMVILHLLWPCYDLLHMGWAASVASPDTHTSHSTSTTHPPRVAVTTGRAVARLGQGSQSPAVLLSCFRQG